MCLVLFNIDLRSPGVKLCQEYQIWCWKIFMEILQDTQFGAGITLEAVEVGGLMVRFLIN